jgi:hypothetical protein
MRLTPLRALAAACLLAVAACAPAACTSTGGVPTISQTLDEKALYTVELAYAGGLASVEAAVDAGALRGEDAARAGTILDQTNSYIVLARRAYAAGETIQAAAEITRAYRSLGELRAIAPPHFTP